MRNMFGVAVEQSLWWPSLAPTLASQAFDSPGCGDLEGLRDGAAVEYGTRLSVVQRGPGLAVKYAKSYCVPQYATCMGQSENSASA